MHFATGNRGRTPAGCGLFDFSVANSLMMTRNKQRVLFSIASDMGGFEMLALMFPGGKDPAPVESVCHGTENVMPRLHLGIKHVRRTWISASEGEQHERR
jgi:hypothetical protein